MSGAPLRILLSRPAAERLRAGIGELLQDRPYLLLPPDAPGLDADIALVSRDVTATSTKFVLEPVTRAYYDAMEGCASLRWVHVHSAGADRPAFVRLRQRGVQLTTSSGANSMIVAHSALAGILALARRLPQLLAAQRERRWAHLIALGAPPDLQGGHAVLVGWGPIAQDLARMLLAVGLRVTVVRQQDQPAGPGLATVTTPGLAAVLPQADWLILACPLTARTRGLVDASMLALLPSRACFVNVARGEIVDEQALIAALQQGQLAGAFLDVFAQEPLPPESPLWTLPNVIATPHSAGISAGNPARVEAMFLDNLRRWLAGQALHKLVTD